MYFPVNDDLISVTKPQKFKYDALFAGGQTKAKGFGDFLEVCAYCAERKHDFKAEVVGTVDAYPGTRDFIAKHHLEDAITFTGRFPTQAGLFEAYRQSNVFLAPTYNDAFASTIRENMLLGVPCMAYRTGGIPYANNDGNENVVIVDQGDWQTMAEKVLHYASHEEERLTFAARAKAYAEKTFSLSANVGVIKQMYEKVLNHGIH
jgi:glycosyltransferase involved in cell wall biosynthesis